MTLQQQCLINKSQAHIDEHVFIPCSQDSKCPLYINAEWVIIALYSQVTSNAIVCKPFFPDKYLKYFTYELY